MAVKRPGVVTMLAILAGVAAVLTGYKLLIYLGVIPPSLGALYLFGANSLGALATGIKSGGVGSGDLWPVDDAALGLVADVDRCHLRPVPVAV